MDILTLSTADEALGHWNERSLLENITFSRANREIDAVTKTI